MGASKIRGAPNTDPNSRAPIMKTPSFWKLLYGFLVQGGPKLDQGSWDPWDLGILRILGSCGIFGFSGILGSLKRLQRVPKVPRNGSRKLGSGRDGFWRLQMLRAYDAKLKQALEV